MKNQKKKVERFGTLKPGEIRVGSVRFKYLEQTGNNRFLFWAMQVHGVFGGFYEYRFDQMNKEQKELVEKAGDKQRPARTNDPALQRK